MEFVAYPSNVWASSFHLGTIIGAYASSNAGAGTTPAFFRRWRYTPIAQQVGLGEASERTTGTTDLTEATLSISR